MTDAAPGIFVALEQSGFAAAIRQSPAGLLSLGIWVAVAACGRSIAYF